MKAIIKPIIIIVLLIVAGVIGYNMFFGGGAGVGVTKDTLTSVTTGTAPTQTATLEEQTSGDIGQQFVALLLSIQSINLDGEIFSDPAFVALQDYSVRVVQPGNEGRKNPFAPIGGAPIVVPQSETTDTGPLAR